MKIDHLTNGANWVQPSGEGFHLSCCDCGSTHFIKLIVENAEEISIQLFASDAVTDEIRVNHSFMFVHVEKLIKYLKKSKKKIKS